MVTLDTSAVLAIVNHGDPDHARMVNALGDDRGPYVIPAGILAEVTYFLVEDFGTRLLLSFLDDLGDGRYLLDCGDQDLARIRSLVVRYDDLPLGFADSAVIACAERHGGKVLTLDLRHFGVVAREGTIAIAP